MQCNADDHCKRCNANENEIQYTEPCKRTPKCLNCGEEYFSTSHSCKVWQKEKKNIIAIKYRESLSLQKPGKSKTHDTFWVPLTPVLRNQIH